MDRGPSVVFELYNFLFEIVGNFDTTVYKIAQKF